MSGVPNGVLNILTQKAPLLSQLPNLNLDFGKVFFSGCFEDGQKMREWNSKTNIEVEINAPSRRPAAIIINGADVDSAVFGVLELFCLNDPRSDAAGCSVLVQDSIKENFLQRLLDRFVRLQVGNALAQADIPSIVVPDNQERASYLLKSFEEDGAKVVSVKHFPSNIALPVPSVVYDVATTSLMMEKAFRGQFLIVTSFRTIREAIMICNHEKSGCDVSIWCEDLAPALQVAHKLKTANVWLNCQNKFDVLACYGSTYASGNAAIGGEMGFLRFVKKPEVGISEEIKYVPSDGSKSKMDFWNSSFRLYIGGLFRNSSSGHSISVYNVAGVEIGVVPNGFRKDIRDAVESAAGAKKKWQDSSRTSRGEMLYRVAKALESKKKEFSDLIQDLTHISAESSMKEVTTTIRCVYYWAAICDKQFHNTIRETHMYGKVLESLEPLDVIGIVCPDNYPLMGFMSLIVPALIQGNCAVVLPSEKYPFVALKLCEVFDACRMPAGVVNVITGSVLSLVQDLAMHMDVEAIWVPRDKPECVEIASKHTVCNQKRMWAYKESDWASNAEEIVVHSTYVKTVWVPISAIFAN